MAKAPDVRLQYGPMLLGVFLNMILFGVLILQTYHYYLTYPKDKKWLKLFVLYLFIIEMVNTGCDMYIMYQPLIEEFGLIEAERYFPTLFAAEPISIVAVSTPIQLFLAWRVWLFTKSKILSLIIVSFALVSFAGGIWTTFMVIKIKLFIRKPELHTPVLTWFLSACAADILITVGLVFTLHRKKTGFVATDDVIAKIIRLTVQTGLVTTVFALGDVIFFMTLPNMALNYLASCKLYATCLLSTLNSRALLKSRAFEHHSAPRHTPVARRNDGAFQPGSPSKEAPYPPDDSSNTGSIHRIIHPHGKFSDKQPDLEYGVTISTVIETIREDDILGSPVEHTQ